MKINLLHTVSLENIKLEIPDTFADLEKVVVVKDQEFFQLKSTLPDDVKKKKELVDQFENAEFENIRQKYYSDLDENTKTDEFEKDFTEKISALIKEKYSELNAIVADHKAILHTICMHFIVHAVFKNRDIKREELNKAQKKDDCYGIDYAMRLTELFKKLALENPESIRLFSAELSDIESFMKSDPRRHAGFDKLFSGITLMVTSLANIFISKDAQRDKVNLVKAFQEAAENNKDRDAMIARINNAVTDVTKYYDMMIANVRSIEPSIKRAHENLATACLLVARGLVTQFVTATNDYVSKFDEKNPEESNARAGVYRQTIEQFCTYLDDLLMAYDDMTKNVRTGEEHEARLFYIWERMTEFKSSTESTWPGELANVYVTQFNDLFGDLPIVDLNTIKDNA